MIESITADVRKNDANITQSKLTLGDFQTEQSAELKEQMSRIQHQEDLLNQFKKEIREEVRQVTAASQTSSKKDAQKQVNLSQN